MYFVPKITNPIFSQDNCDNFWPLFKMVLRLCSAFPTTPLSPRVDLPVSRTLSPFELVYGGLGAFDSFDDARVVWIGLEEGLEPMRRLAELLQRDEPRPFAPHLTLGRRRRAPAPAEFLAALRAEPPLSLRRPVERLSLYASRPAPFGHAYQILLEAPLGGG